MGKSLAAVSALQSQSGPPSTSSRGGFGGPGSTLGDGLSSAAVAAFHEEKAAALKVLQQHIDELTSEKLELMRGLQQQLKSNEGLSEENENLSQQYTELMATLKEERKKVGMGAWGRAGRKGEGVSLGFHESI
jgi:hypothetical protein